MEIIVCNNNEIGINSYLIKVNHKAVVIDPNNYEEITNALGTCILDYIFLTHEHFDHIMAVDKLRVRYGTKVIAQKFASEHIQSSSRNLSKFSNIILDFMNKKVTTPINEFTIKAADIIYLDSYNLIWEGHNFLFTHTPGHTKGSSCITVDNHLFSGDSLFECCETDTKGIGTGRKEYDTITIPFFKTLKNDTIIHAGHYPCFILEDKLNAREKAIKIFVNRPKYTNLFVNYADFNLMLDHCDFFTRNNSIFIIKKDTNFYRFYYFINEYKDLNNLDDFFGLYKKPIVLEIVTKNNIDIHLYKEIGFLSYKIYSRYVKKEIHKDFDTILLACINDIEYIKEIIDKIFDPLSDYIPTISELINFIQKGEVYITKDNDKLSGVAIYQKSEYSYYLRLFCVHPDYRRKSIGSMLTEGLPKDNERCIAWIDNENEISIKINKKIGYKKDSLKNHIFVYSNKKI